MLSIGVPIAMQWWEGTRQSFKFYIYFLKYLKILRKLVSMIKIIINSFEIFILAHDIKFIYLNRS